MTPHVPSNLSISTDSSSESDEEEDDSLLSVAQGQGPLPLTDLLHTHPALDADHDDDGDKTDDNPNDNICDVMDTEDAPNWELDTNEIKTPELDYSFCHPVHRSQILGLLTKHFASTQASLTEMVYLILLQRFNISVSMRCIISVNIGAFGGSRHIYGLLGTSQRCGPSGPAHPIQPIFPTSEPP